MATIAFALLYATPQLRLICFIEDRDAVENHKFVVINQYALLVYFTRMSSISNPKEK